MQTIQCSASIYREETGPEKRTDPQGGKASLKLSWCWSLGNPNSIYKRRKALPTENVFTSLVPSSSSFLPSFFPPSLPSLPSRRGGEKGFTWLKKLSLWTSCVARSITTQRCFYGGCGSGTSTCCRCGHLFKKKRKLSLS